MKIVKTGLKFKDLGTAPFAIETPPEHIKLHTVCVVLGKRAAGKSFFVSNLMAWLEFDRILKIDTIFSMTKRTERAHITQNLSNMSKFNL